MCGRYSFNITRQRFEQVYEIQAPLEFAPRYNIAPTQQATIIRQTESDAQASMARWGYQQPGKSLLINARAETVGELPTFAQSFRQRRCIVPATGWYEWQASSTGKHPHHLYRTDQEPLAFAGIWTPSSNGDQFAIITQAADAAIREIHDRQPVILNRERWRVWLADTPLAELEAELKAILEETPVPLEAYPVGLRVSSVRHDDASLLERIEIDRGLFGFLDGNRDGL